MPTQSPLRERFPHRKAGHCGSGALRDLLELHGLDFGAGPLSEGTVFGLAGGLGFFFLEIPAMRPPLYLVGRTADLERDFATHLGIGLELRQTDDAEEGLHWVRDELTAGRPPMVWADIAELEYLRVRMSNTRHGIVVVDLDEDEGVAWIADNDREELQRCSLASLAAARNSGGFPGPNRHKTFLYDWPEQLGDPRPAVDAALARAVANMREHDGSGHGPAEAYGLRGVDAFAAAYSGWPDRFGDDLGAALRGLRVFIVKAGTGGAMFRSLQATFLRDMAALLGAAELREAAGVFDELTAAWLDLAEAAAAGDHTAGLGPVARVAELEHAGVAALDAARSDG